MRDNADQFNGFGYASYKFGSSSSLTAIGGAESFKYKIPNTALDAAVLGLNRQALFDSSQLDQSQWNQTRFGILAYQYSNDSWDVTILPIRLSPTPTKCGVHPFTGIQPVKGRCGCPTRDTHQQAERVEG